MKPIKRGFSNSLERSKLNTIFPEFEFFYGLVVIPSTSRWWSLRFWAGWWSLGLFNFSNSFLFSVSCSIKDLPSFKWRDIDLATRTGINTYILVFSKFNTVWLLAIDMSNTDAFSCLTNSTYVHWKVLRYLIYLFLMVYNIRRWCMLEISAYISY